MELTKNDYNNLLTLLQRIPVQGLAEAEGLVVLAVKLRHAATPSPVEVPESPKTSRSKKREEIPSELS